MIKLFYYDGHYVDSPKSLEEIERELEVLKEEEKKLTEWPKVD